MIRTLLFVPLTLAFAAVTIGCTDGVLTTATTDAATTDPTTDPTTTTTTTTGEGTTEASTTASTTESESGGLRDDIPGEGNICSLLLQDCPQGQKCVAWNMGGGIFPDGVKCVDIPGDPDGIGEPCVTYGGFGSGEDSCDKGAMCFDLANEGEGTCVGHCTGTDENPVCNKPDESCVTVFEPPVPLCFVRCDPLVQDCPEGEGCYMDDATIGSDGFVCMPTVLAPNENGDFGDLCYNQAGCAPGFSCIYPENVPGCKYMYCCSPWCDLVENPEYCKELDPTMECIPWYEPGSEQPGYENVGICGLPI